MAGRRFLPWKNRLTATLRTNYDGLRKFVPGIGDAPPPPPAGHQELTLGVRLRTAATLSRLVASIWRISEGKGGFDRDGVRNGGEGGI